MSGFLHVWPSGPRRRPSSRGGWGRYAAGDDPRPRSSPGPGPAAAGLAGCGPLVGHPCALPGQRAGRGALSRPAVADGAGPDAHGHGRQRAQRQPGGGGAVGVGPPRLHAGLGGHRVADGRHGPEGLVDGAPAARAGNRVPAGHRPRPGAGRRAGRRMGRDAGRGVRQHRHRRPLPGGHAVHRHDVRRRLCAGCGAGGRHHLRGDAGPGLHGGAAAVAVPPRWRC